ncbi:MAG: PIN domain-containing protein [Acetobacteraceae bacterium]|nr:PIN domain-containing protein [Acetobacteraceae bacterium]
MKPIVLDAGAALAAILPERHSEAARTLLLRIAEDGAIVPAIWHLEIANSLLAAERCGLLTQTQRNIALHHLATLPIATDPETAPRAWSHTIILAHKYGLSVQDAAYLELALRRQTDLATFDASLLRAAEAAGVRGAKPPLAALS